MDYYLLYDNKSNFDFEHKNNEEDLISEITKKLKSNPDKLEDFYKIVMALTK